MSKAYYIASDFELPEVDYTGVKKETLKDIKKINPFGRFGLEMNFLILYQRKA